MAPPPPRASGVSASFSLRCVTSNVCIFPLATRNRTAVVQLLVGLVSNLMLLAWLLPLTPLPLLLQLLAAPFLALLLLPLMIPLQGLLVVLLSRGQWHDHKRGRLSLLLRRLNEFDVVALQELFSGVFDTRYRDLVIREASAAGLHYSVACGRLPVWPAMLLNTGTLLLSRYPIVASRTIVFQTRAFYDWLIVNRGASWMRLQLPHGRTVDYFTLHLAPPLSEVAGRVGLLVSYCKCPQEAQLQELMAFMRECIAQDRSPEQAASAHVVLAGDFNLDCGSLRYFGLLHSLHQLGLKQPMVDVFAIEGDAQSPYNPMSLEGEVEQSDDDDQDDRSPEAPGAAATSVITSRRKVTSSVVTSHAHSPFSSAAASSSSSTVSALAIQWNEWRAGVGNGREVFCASSHAQLPSAQRSKHLRWESTFGQRLVGHPTHTHLETFLTHETLLGSHSTHDYFFTNCRPANQRVEAFFAPHAHEALLRPKLGAGSALPPPSPTSSPPPFTQLSDHCALVATLLLPSGQAEALDEGD